MSINKKTTIILIGSTGEGKSSFGNYILKHDEKKFKESQNSESCTEKIISHKGKDGTDVENLYIIDTPGSSDSKGRDSYFIKNILEELVYNYKKDINSFLLLFNINKIRLSFEIKKQLYYYCLMFPIKDFWFHVGIVFTFSYEYFPDDQFESLKKNKNIEFIEDFTNTIKSHIDEINNLNGYNIRKPEKFNVFFTDCGKVYPPYTHKRTDIEIKKIIEWVSKLDKLDLTNANINIDINYKYKKRIDDYIEDNKIWVNSNKYKIIKRYKKQYKTIDFQNNNNIYSESDFYKKEIKYYKLYEGKNLISDETRIYNDKHFKNTKTYEYYDRWDEVNEYNRIIRYGRRENIYTNTESKIISRNWKVFNTDYKTEKKIIEYDYELEHEKHWVLFIPVTTTYKQPYRLVQNVYYRKVDEVDDLGYKRYGDWYIYDYGSTTRDYYTSRYKI